MRLHFEKRYPHRNKLKAIFIIFTGLLAQAVKCDSLQYRRNWGALGGHWGHWGPLTPSTHCVLKWGFLGIKIEVIVIDLSPFFSDFG